MRSCELRVREGTEKDREWIGRARERRGRDREDALKENWMTERRTGTDVDTVQGVCQDRHQNRYQDQDHHHPDDVAEKLPLRQCPLHHLRQTNHLRYHLIPREQHCHADNHVLLVYIYDIFEKQSKIQVCEIESMRRPCVIEIEIVIERQVTRDVTLLYS